MKRSPSAALICVTVSMSFGQPVPSLTVFEAASVKPSSPGDVRGATFGFTPGGGLKITNGTLRGIIEMAYGVRDFQIVGGPGWLNSDRYDISARSTPGAPGGIAETRLRLQTLLASRFQLKVHRETRELPVYALVVARGGSKLFSAPAPVGEQSMPGIRAECGRMTGTMTSMTNLGVYLERQLRRSVLDRTGLTGRYNFELDWMPDSGPCATPAPDGAAVDSSGGPSLFTALQEELGLKLESTKGPVEVIFLDHAEKADDN
jgi:uncharacterized protein (TIGR03435 family)